MIAWLLGVAMALAGPHGFRGDGTGRFPDATPPIAPTTPCWRHETEASGNASPVRFGTQICVLEEPTTVLCLDADSGAVRWRREIDLLDALPEAQREKLAPRLAALPELEAQRREAARALGLARRAGRRGDTTGPTVAEATAELERIQRALDALDPFTTPPDKDLIGYASPTPVADGDRLFVLLGHGVLASFDPTGTLRWSRWLGPPPGSMRGFDFGQTASPVLVGDTLAVAYGALRGIDPDTGAVRWTGPEQRDYGTPAAVELAGVSAVATPDGHLVRTDDGQVLAEGLGDLWYTGPVVHDDRLYYVGGHGNERQEGLLTARAWQLVAASDGIEARPLWDLDLQMKNRLYGTPVWADGHLWFLARTLDLVAIDTASGTVAHRSRIDQLGTEAWAGPLLGGDTLVFVTRGGGWVTTSPTLPLTPTVHELGAETRSTPWLEGTRAWVRTVDAVTCYERR